MPKPIRIAEPAPVNNGPKPVARPLTPEWFEARKTTLGASEIAVAAGLSKFQTPLELYHRKRGELPEIEETDAMRLGRLLEPVIKAEFVHHTGLQLLDPLPPMYRHARHPEIVATPDGMVTPKEVLECKSTTFRSLAEWGSEGTDEAPIPYVVQCQMQTEVMEADLAHLALLIDGSAFRHYRILKSESLIKMLIASALELLERIRDGRPPEPTWTHPSTPQLIRELHGIVNDTRIVFTDEECLWQAEYEAASKTKDEMEKRMKLLRAQQLHVIGDHYAGLLGDGRMLRRKEIEVAGYTVAPTKKIDCRVVKADAGRIVDRTPQPFSLEDKDASPK